MGILVKGECLTAEELHKMQGVIDNITLDRLLYRFKQAEPRGTFEPTPQILSAGLETEVFLADKNYQLTPHYALFEQTFGTEVSPELLKVVVETMTQESDLFNLTTPFKTVHEHNRELIGALQDTAKHNNLRILQAGMHPRFNPEDAEDWVSDNARYRKLIDFIDGYGTNSFSIDFVKGEEERQGMVWEGGTAGVQVTLKVPTRFAPWYHDASYIFQSVALAVTAASPFVEGRATKYSSSRYRILPACTYGFSQEEKEAGRAGRMRVLEFSLTQENGYAGFVDDHVLGALRGIGVEEGLAKYVAALARDGTMIITPSDLDKSYDDTSFPGPTSWPWVKLRYDTLFDEDGIGIELRAMETMGSARGNASLVYSSLAFVQGLTEQLLGEIKEPLSCEQVDYNMEVTSSVEGGDVYWPTQEGVKKMSIREVFRDLGEIAVDVLTRYRHSPKEQQQILNPVLMRAGVRYAGGEIVNCDPLPTVSQLMREHAYAAQPDVAQGAVLTQITLEKVLKGL